MRDFAYHSRYPTTVITGINRPGFDNVRFLIPRAARWFENRTRCYARGCAEIIKREQPALVEIHNRPRLLPMIAARVAGNFVLHLHNDPQEMDGTQTSAKRKKLLSQCAGIYCVSNYIKSRFMEGLPEIDAAKLHVIYNGIAIPASRPLKENIIVYAGRMTEGKGALLLAHALRKALPQLPGWRAILIGSRRHSHAHTLTPHEEQIAETLAPIGSQIELPGFLSHSDTLAYFARSAIAVVPSIWQEPFGRTAIEAMAYGCALISSGRGGLSEVTQESALTLTNLAVPELAESILKLATNVALREQLQQDGLKRAEYFSIVPRTKALDDARDAIYAASLVRCESVPHT